MFVKHSQVGFVRGHPNFSNMEVCQCIYIYGVDGSILNIDWISLAGCQGFSTYNTPQKDSKVCPGWYRHTDMNHFQVSNFPFFGGYYIYIYTSLISYYKCIDCFLISVPFQYIHLLPAITSCELLVVNAKCLFNGIYLSGWILATPRQDRKVTFHTKIVKA